MLHGKSVQAASEEVQRAAQRLACLAWENCAQQRSTQCQRSHAPTAGPGPLQPSGSRSSAGAQHTVLAQGRPKAIAL